jgi:hypothetical protein
MSLYSKEKNLESASSETYGLTMLLLKIFSKNTFYLFVLIANIDLVLALI